MARLGRSQPFRPKIYRPTVMGAPPSLTAGVASFVSSGPGGIAVTATDATNGTAPYTYQWQRNTNGGSYSNLSGATSRSITDATASAGTLYGYKLVYTDNASATVTSNAITAQVYTGGSLSAGLARVIGG